MYTLILLAKQYTSKRQEYYKNCDKSKAKQSKEQKYYLHGKIGMKITRITKKEEGFLKEQSANAN